MKSYLKKFDWILGVSAIFLLAIGYISIFSATMEISSKGLSHPARQAIAIFIGTILFFLFTWIDYRILKKISFLIYIALLAILILVILFGSKIKGTSGWFRFGSFGLQPVEFVKIAMIIILAKFFSKNFRRLNQLKFIIASGVITIIPIGLVLLQPDAGSAFVIFCIWAGLALVAGIKKTHLALLIILAAAAGILGWRYGLKEYQKSRVTSFINPYSDPQGRGYNAIQSIVAVGSGGIFGKGIGNGSQGRLNFLPERHTDFIFANICEELGFTGAIFILVLYAILLWRIISAALKVNDNFARFLIIGFAVMITTHILENIGMNIALMPIAGIPLPLLSFGGSNIMVTLISLGIIESALIHKTEKLENIGELDFS